MPGHTLTRGERVPSRIRQRLNPKAVACPACGAKLGETCTTERGSELRSSHISRIRMATRAYNESGPIVIAQPSRRLELVRLRQNGCGMHVAVGNRTACGKTFNLHLAIRDQKFASGIAADVTCSKCLATLTTPGQSKPTP